MLKKFFAGLLFIILIGLLLEIRVIWQDEESARQNYEGVKKQLEEAQKERGRFEADLHYLSVPENLTKEIRNRFHYQDPREKVLIAVPSSTNSTSSD